MAAANSNGPAGTYSTPDRSNFRETPVPEPGEPRVSDRGMVIIGNCTQFCKKRVQNFGISMVEQIVQLDYSRRPHLAWLTKHSRLLIAFSIALALGIPLYTYREPLKHRAL